MVSTVKGDRASRPRVEFRCYGFDGVYVPQRTLPLLPWYVGGVDHVHHLDRGREGFLASAVRPAGLSVSSLCGLVPESSA